MKVEYAHTSYSVTSRMSVMTGSDERDDSQYIDYFGFALFEFVEHYKFEKHKVTNFRKRNTYGITSTVWYR